MPEMLPEPVVEDEATAARFPSGSFSFPLPLSVMHPSGEPHALLVSDPRTLVKETELAVDGRLIAPGTVPPGMLATSELWLPAA